EVIAQQLQVVLDLRLRGVAGWRRADGDGGERGAEVRSVVRLPRLVMKVEPRPGPRQITGPHLKRPHVAEPGARVVAETAAFAVARRQDQRVEDRFGASRLA